MTEPIDLVQCFECGARYGERDQSRCEYNQTGEHSFDEDEMYAARGRD